MEWRLELKGCLVMMGDGVDVDVDDGEGEGDDGGRRKDAKKPTVEMRLTSAEAYVAPCNDPVPQAGSGRVLAVQAASFPLSKITRIPGFDIPLAEHGYIEHVSGAYGGTHWRNFCSSRDIAKAVQRDLIGFHLPNPARAIPDRALLIAARNPLALLSLCALCPEPAPRTTLTA
ncbi:hypothetical protein CISG_06820 [Coccidioides immitis RMSCC 3703]|uniref:Uncharacterized protein n=2 Tax=Coccidioides immitis TaxID=5501 RepID=A0A0J8R2X9_COCIT|nr:hypothetical protein CIRG_06889 [Coccidioides immitis RMSCC 2394]KMU78058.1 hypothetical protein CISG_06820 [Coccidioides immitis RMSCC 3703]